MGDRNGPATPSRLVCYKCGTFPCTCNSIRIKKIMDRVGNNRQERKEGEYMSEYKWPFAFGITADGADLEIVWSSDDDGPGPVDPSWPKNAKHYVDGDVFHQLLNDEFRWRSRLALAEELLREYCAVAPGTDLSSLHARISEFLGQSGEGQR